MKTFMKKHIETPLTKDKLEDLVAGDVVLITGTIYTSRDAAHKRLVETLQAGEELPYDVRDTIVYYVGPTPSKAGQVFGAAGPTTSYRMDAYSPTMIKLGQTGMIGKGKRSKEVIDTMVDHGAVYFGAIGGAGATLAKSIISSETIAYDDLGAEALRKLQVEDFPVFVIIDSKGNNLYETGPADYLKSLE